MAKLVCQSGPNAGHEHALTSTKCIFGRHADCTGQIPDPKASREHFKIQKHGKIWAVVDLKSRNGTRLNGNKINERILEFGDCVSVGACEFIFTQEEGDSSLSDLLSKYDLDGRVGQGGMGIVYKALQRSMDRTVALKILSPKYTNKKGFVDQFVKEARAAGALNHPNIIQVHDVGAENGVHYFSMEFINGPTCLHLLKSNGPLSPSQTLEIGLQTAKALEYAHDHKLIHRDIKPDNIMLANGSSVKLADLGISKTFDEAENEGDSKRKITGTPHYIAPEAAKGNKLDHRIDLYSLGATLYHLITGKTPHHGKNPAEILKSLINEPVPALQELNADIPDSIVTVIDKLMAKNPDDRYQNAADVILAIEAIQSSNDVDSRQNGDGETLILKRLATGAPLRSDAEGDSSHHTNHTTNGSNTDNTALNTTVTLFRSLQPSQLLLIGIIVIAMAIIGVSVFSKDASDPIPNPDTNNVIDDNQTVNDPRTTDTATANPADGAPTATEPTLHERQVHERQQLQALDIIDKEIRVATTSAELSAINRKLRDIHTQKLSRVAKRKASSVQKQLNRNIEQIQKKSASDAFTKLKAEIEELTNIQEFSTALQRIDATLQQHGQYLGSRVNSLKRSVNEQHTLYFSTTNRKIKTLARDGKKEELQALLKNLSPAILDSDIPQKINSAINDIDAKKLAAHADYLTQAQQRLGKWQLASTLAYCAEVRPALGNSPTGKALDVLIQNTTLLQKMTTGINRGLQGRVKFRGKIRHLIDPYLDGASEDEFRIRMDNGGKMKMRWADIKPETMRKIILLARVNPNDYTDALAAQKIAAESSSSE